MAAYAGLKSYADSGTIIFESGRTASPSVEQHTFKTYFRAPRHYYYEFNEDRKAGGDRWVIWGDPGTLYTWWSATGVQTAYPVGKGANAFMSSPHARVIASALFPQARLASTITELGDVTEAGVELVGGVRAYKLTGVARAVYGTGHQSNVRSTTVWIDAETLMIRKVLEDTPRGHLAGHVSRYTLTLDPRVNPALEDRVFGFTPPATLR
jgi:hypothetical protein